MFSSSVLRASGWKAVCSQHLADRVRRSFSTGEVWEAGRAMGSPPKWEQTCDFGVVRVPPSHSPAASLCGQLLARKPFPSKLPFCFWAPVAAGGIIRGRMGGPALHLHLMTLA